MLANHFLADNSSAVTKWYQREYNYDKNEVSYLNNYAYALGQLHCYLEAKSHLAQALNLAPNDANLLDTQQQLLQLRQQYSNQ